MPVSLAMLGSARMGISGGSGVFHSDLGFISGTPSLAVVWRRWSCIVGLSIFVLMGLWIWILAVRLLMEILRTRWAGCNLLSCKLDCHRLASRELRPNDRTKYCLFQHLDARSIAHGAITRAINQTVSLFSPHLTQSQCCLLQYQVFQCIVH